MPPTKKCWLEQLNHCTSAVADCTFPFFGWLSPPRPSPALFLPRPFLPFPVSKSLSVHFVCTKGVWREGQKDLFHRKGREPSQFHPSHFFSWTNRRRQQRERRQQVPSAAQLCPSAQRREARAQHPAPAEDNQAALLDRGHLLPLLAAP